LYFQDCIAVLDDFICQSGGVLVTTEVYLCDFFSLHGLKTIGFVRLRGAFTNIVTAAAPLIPAGRGRSTLHRQVGRSRHRRHPGQVGAREDTSRRLISGGGMGSMAAERKFGRGGRRAAGRGCAGLLGREARARIARRRLHFTGPTGLPKTPKKKNKSRPQKEAQIQ
jgi:hypothetical protein